MLIVRKDNPYEPWQMNFVRNAVEGAIKKSKETDMTGPCMGPLKFTQTEPAPVETPTYKRFLTDKSSAERKEYPIVTGVLDYFPDAIAMVAHVSYLGNQKHNPGQPLHWSRGKSADHLDCIGRHLTEREEIDTANIVHMANAAWRSLAELQMLLEKTYGLSLPYGAK